jgi:hypothetical protein
MTLMNSSLLPNIERSRQPHCQKAYKLSDFWYPTCHRSIAEPWLIAFEMLGQYTQTIPKDYLYS